MESGTEDNFWSVNWPEQNPEEYTRSVAEQLNCTVGADGEELENNDMIECLREVPWPDLQRTRFQCAVGHPYVVL